MAFKTGSEKYTMAMTTEGSITRLSYDQWGMIARKHGMPQESTAQTFTDYPRRRRKARLTFMGMLQGLQQICDSTNWGRW